MGLRVPRIPLPHALNVILSYDLPGRNTNNQFALERERAHRLLIINGPSLSNSRGGLHILVMADSDTGAAAPGVSNPPCPVPSTAYPPVVVSFIRQFLTETEVTQLGQQFQSSWQPNRQVMWTGNIRYKADEWARRKRMRTLSIAMGPLEKNGEALGIHKSKEKGGRTQYMRGASALFAWYITADDVVTILCPPPPERFNPGGGTNLQLVELPILIGIIGGRAVSRIEVVHPMIKGAENFSYQLWPVDEVNTWLQNFAQASIARFPWLRRARPSRVLNIERLLRSMLSDSTDPIYHAMLPQEGLASTTMLTLASSEVRWCCSQCQLTSLFMSARPLISHAGLSKKKGARNATTDDHCWWY